MRIRVLAPCKQVVQGKDSSASRLNLAPYQSCNYILKSRWYPVLFEIWKIAYTRSRIKNPVKRMFGIANPERLQGLGDENSEQLQVSRLEIE